jgi:hypothetical protein
MGSDFHRRPLHDVRIPVMRQCYDPNLVGVFPGKILNTEEMILSERTPTRATRIQFICACEMKFIARIMAHLSHVLRGRRVFYPHCVRLGRWIRLTSCHAYSENFDLMNEKHRLLNLPSQRDAILVKNRSTS